MGTRPLVFPEQPKDPVVQRRLSNLEQRSLTRPQIDQQPVYDIPASGSRAATVIVAASNAYPDSQEGADFVCTGTDDHLTIQDACDVGSGYPGGRVLLTEGDFALGGPVSPYDSQILEGYGHNATFLAAVSGLSTAAMIDRSASSPFDVTVRNLALYGDGNARDGINFRQGAYCRIERVSVADVTRYGIGLTRTGFDHTDEWIVDNYLNQCGDSGIFVDGSNRVTIRGNHCTFCDAGIKLAGGQSAIVEGNPITSVDVGVYLDTTNLMLVVGNWIDASVDGVYLVSADRTNIVANIIDGATRDINISNAACDDTFITTNRLSGGTPVADSGTGTVKINNRGDDI